MTGNGADRKRISCKLRSRRGFSKHSLSEINLEPCPNLSRRAVKIPHFPRRARSSSTYLEKVNAAPYFSLVLRVGSPRPRREFLGDLCGKKHEARFRKTVYRCCRPKLPLWGDRPC